MLSRESTYWVSTGEYVQPCGSQRAESHLILLYSVFVLVAVHFDNLQAVPKLLLELIH